MAKTLDPIAAWVVRGLEETGKSNTALAKHLGIEQPRIAEIKAGKRKVKATEIEPIAQFLGIPPPLTEVGQRQVPVVGYVSASGMGAEAYYYSFGDAPDDWVPMPPGGTERTVAVEIRGDSLGSMFNTWLVYYDDRHDPPRLDLLRKLCVVGLADGRTLVKRLVKGSAPGLYNLESNFQSTIEDVVIEWAAKVTHMTPR